jgi:hypothetical protein
MPLNTNARKVKMDEEPGLSIRISEQDSTSSDRAASPLPAARALIAVSQIDYHGWKVCYMLASSTLEAIVVPAIGRVMQLRRIGDSGGVLWENRRLDGQIPQPNSGTWANFGGDKCWPAPQSDWLRVLGHEWPPPAALDASPFETSVTDSGMALKSPVEPAWGIQAVRHVELDSAEPVMRVRTEFRKVQGKPVRVAIWTIAQFSDPACVAIEVPVGSRFGGGYAHLSNAAPAELVKSGRLLTFVRHPQTFVKIGSDAHEIVWVGPSSVVRMESELLAGEHPDGGCSIEVYTNPGEQKYVELETLGTLVNLEVGQATEHTTTYTVLPRTTADARVDAQKAFQGISE